MLSVQDAVVYLFPAASFGSLPPLSVCNGREMVSAFNVAVVVDLSLEQVLGLGEKLGGFNLYCLGLISPVPVSMILKSLTSENGDTRRAEIVL